MIAKTEHTLYILNQYISGQHTLYRNTIRLAKNQKQNNFFCLEFLGNSERGEKVCGHRETAAGGGSPPRYVQ